MRTRRNKSYTPSINKRLVTLRSSRSRKSIVKCNNYNAFLLKEPIKIHVRGKCYPYTSSIAKQFLLDNLRANKHINPNKIITPIQSHSNCWFNTMFVSLFMSDKGRKFFHFFRQMMIEGKRSNGEPIPPKLWNAFALLNFAIEVCLTGNPYAYRLNTNKIIRDIYLAINEDNKDPYIVDVDYANNPIMYYNALMNYLNVDDINIVDVYAYNNNWIKSVEDMIASTEKPPHIIVLSIMDAQSKMITNKPKELIIGASSHGYKYVLDSSVVRDDEKEHFCAMITCEGKEFGYDGASFHRLVQMNWKNYLNKDKNWKFKGTERGPGDPLHWSFMNGYQMLLYYRG